jgi:hypothetical protein
MNLDAVRPEITSIKLGLKPRGSEMLKDVIILYRTVIVAVESCVCRPIRTFSLLLLGALERNKVSAACTT